MSTESIYNPIPPNRRSTRADHPFGIYNIELTNRCPMKCIMCPRTNNMTRPQGFMDCELFQRAIDELVSINPEYIDSRMVWLHHFGESLLHPRFGDCIEYASSKGVLTGLSINPFILTEDIAGELLRAQPSVLCISLDGHDDDSFYRIRGVKNAYNLSRTRLLDFLQLKKRYNAEITVILSMIHFPMNRASIESEWSFWQSCEGVDQFLEKDFSTWDGNAEDVHALIDDCACRSNDIDRSSVACTLPWEVMTVTWNGDVVPCCYDYNARLVLGNMERESFQEIWNGEKMRALRAEFIDNKVTNELCKNCDKLYLPRDSWKW
ncbi:MAG: radical SAM/SPASM domain-containing protein [Chloroflexota bacterium]|nr:radical SAM/SPASM domain-containing protein [Chloroflexota bacterium]